MTHREYDLYCQGDAETCSSIAKRVRSDRAFNAGVMGRFTAISIISARVGITPTQTYASEVIRKLHTV